MPTKQLESYAERSGKSVKEVERVWDETKKQADKKFPKSEHESEHYWAYVNATTMMRLGIRTPKKKRDKK